MALRGLFNLGRERRRAVRVKPPVSVTAILGRVTGTLVDISPAGARVRHVGSLKTGGDVRLQFRYRTISVAVDARVLASTLVALGGGARYETRLQFREVSEDARDCIAAFLAEVEELQQRVWIRNVQGYEPGPRTPTGPVDSFLRITKVKGEWSEVVTTSREQPHEGFTVPIATTAEEIDLLCETWEIGDPRAHRLLQIMAAMACGSN